MAQIQSAETSGVHVSEWKTVTWTVDADGGRIADNPDHQQQLDEFILCKQNLVLLRLWVDRYGGEWGPEPEYVDYEPVYSELPPLAVGYLRRHVHDDDGNFVGYYDVPLEIGYQDEYDAAYFISWPLAEPASA